MSALFDDAAVVEDDDTVCIADGAETVGDDESGATLHQRVHTTLYEPFRTGVDGGCGLVEDEHRGIRDSSTGDGNQLAFALGEVATIAIENGLIAVAQTTDKIIGSHQTGCTDAVVVSSVELAIADIIDDGACEEVGLLQDDAHALAKRLLADVRHRDAVVEDLSFLDLVETVDEVDDGGLASTRATHEGNLLTWVGVDVDVEEHLLGRGIAKVHICEIDVALKE